MLNFPNKYFILLLVFLIIIPSCRLPDGGHKVINIKGSTTMMMLTKLLSEEYMKNHTDVSIYVEGGGTAAGLMALNEGEAEICLASRTLKPEEISLLANNHKTVGMSFLVAKDGLSIFLNPENPVNDLSMKQLAGIFSCENRDWGQFGGNNGRIAIHIRYPNSGTYIYFKEHVLEGDEYCKEAVHESTIENIRREVAENPNAIGYGGIGFHEGVTYARINGVEPTEENIINDKYPISRYLYFYTIDTPEKHIKDFIDWVLSPQGQKIVKKAGYVPLWKVSP